MDARRVLDHDHVLALAPAIAQLGDGRSGVVQKAGLVGRIAPSPGDHPRAVARTDLVLIGVDDRIQGGRIDQALLDHQRFQRLDPQGPVRRRLLAMAVVVMMIVTVVVVHGDFCRQAPAPRQASAGRLFSGATLV